MTKPINLTLCCVTLLSCLSWMSSGVIVRSYNDVNIKDLKTLEEFNDQYMTHYDAEEEVKNTNTNILLGVSEPQCKGQLEIAAFRGANRHAGSDVLTVVYLPASAFPYKINGCVEVFFYPIDGAFKETKDRTVNFDHAELNEWVGLHLKTTVTLTNKFAFDITVKWNEESMDPVLHGVMKPGQTTEVSTYIGHIFSATATATNELVDFMEVNGGSYEFSPLNRLESCEIGINAPVGMFTQQAVHCDDMNARMLEFSHTAWHQKRLALNYVQPQMVPPVTKEGFLHIQLPADTYKWLRAWYDTQKKLQEIPEGSSGPCMNQKKSPSSITHLTVPEKERLSEELQSTLEGWYGGELELTSIYGIRKYTNGSVLRMHVDTVNTHVVSAIINVDQQLDEEWPLLILDHNDKEHQIQMSPGDMVLYESAKLLHGRPTVMVGSHYDNIFIHYKPTTGWDYSWI